MGWGQTSPSISPNSQGLVSPDVLLLGLFAHCLWRVARDSEYGGLDPLLEEESQTLWQGSSQDLH